MGSFRKRGRHGVNSSPARLRAGGRSLLTSESTVKQHLRGTHKVLGVRDCTEAVEVLRDPRNGDDRDA